MTHGFVLQYSCVGELEFVLGKGVSCSLCSRSNGDCILSDDNIMLKCEVSNILRLVCGRCDVVARIVESFTRKIRQCE
jgi:hypothetical protein